MFVISVTILSVIIGVVLPILVGIVTTKMESRKLKGALLILLSAVAGIINSAILAGGVFTDDAIIAAVISYVIATAMHYGVWKPQGITEKVQTQLGRTDK